MELSIKLVRTLSSDFLLSKIMSQARNLPDALIQFTEAMEKMNKTVLVPRRLMDLSEESLLTLPSKHHVCTESSQRNDENLEVWEEKDSLFGVYQMLQGISDEIVTGRNTGTNNCFHYHMQAVPGTLKHLTTIAKEVTKHYCEISGDPENSLSNVHLAYSFSDHLKV